MADRLQTTAVTAIAGLAALLVVTALIMTGGPFQAREEHRDQVRRSDLLAIKWHAQCMARGKEGGLPAALAATHGCGELPRQQDPFTGADYGYMVLDATTLRLCAGFERPLQGQGRYGDHAISRAAGCLDFEITPGRDED